MKMRKEYLIVVLILALNCSEGYRSIPIVESSQEPFKLIDQGITIGSTNNNLLKSIFPYEYKVIEISPGQLLDSEKTIHYKLFHVTGTDNSFIVTLGIQTNKVDSFKYDEEILDLTNINFHSSELKKKNLEISFEDLGIRRDSLKSRIHKYEIKTTGEILFNGVHNSFSGSMKLKKSTHVYSGEYTGDIGKITVKLSLKDGYGSNCYYGLMHVTTRNCLLQYEIKNQDFSSGIYIFDKEGKMILEIFNNDIIISNLKYDLCDEMNTKYRVQLNKVTNDNKL
jgi:hypothetical protein